MKEYYAMITPGQCSDWGDVILIDRRVGDLLEKATSFWEEEEIEEIVKSFSQEDWQFLRTEFKTELNDQDFISELNDNWDSLMSENYYQFEKLDSTQQFGSITALIQYVNENKCSVIGDLT